MPATAASISTASAARPRVQPRGSGRYQARASGITISAPAASPSHQVRATLRQLADTDHVAGQQRQRTDGRADRRGGGDRGAQAADAADAVQRWAARDQSADQKRRHEHLEHVPDRLPERGAQRQRRSSRWRAGRRPAPRARTAAHRGTERRSPPRPEATRWPRRDRRTPARSRPSPPRSKQRPTRRRRPRSDRVRPTPPERAPMRGDRLRDDLDTRPDRRVGNLNLRHRARLRRTRTDSPPPDPAWRTLSITSSDTISARCEAGSLAPPRYTAPMASSGSPHGPTGRHGREKHPPWLEISHRRSRSVFQAGRTGSSPLRRPRATGQPMSP